MTMTDSEILALPQSWSMAEVMDAFHVSDKKLYQLMRDGVVGYIVGKNKSRHFMADHIGQIREALEVKAAAPISPDAYALIGVTRSAARRRRSS